MGENWYDNKALFEMIQDLKEDMQAMSQELKQTREIVAKYNCLRQRLDAIEFKAAGRSAVGQAIREWGGWLVALVSLIITFYKLVGGI